jgi:hypothetical protein
LKLPAGTRLLPQQSSLLVPQVLPAPSPPPTQLGGRSAVAHTLGTPEPPQTSGLSQAPQFRRPPQASLIVPQFLPCAAHVVGTHPQTFAVPPPPQVCGS